MSEPIVSRGSVPDRPAPEPPIRRIILENFMSHRRTVIEPAPGLTVLTGPNNCGKSAVVAALRALTSGAKGDYMVRHGEKVCRVIVETGDGHTVEWKRKGTSVSYTIDGTEVHRVGSGTPDDLHRVLRLPPVEGPDGKAVFDIHLAEQKSPIFLLDRPASEAALFFASSSDAWVLLEMQRRHRQKVQDRKQEAARLEQEAASLEAYLQVLAPVDEVDERLRAVEEDGRALETAEADARCLQEALLALERAAVEVRRTGEQARELSRLDSPPLLVDAAPLEALRDALQATEREVEQLSARLRVLWAADVPPTQEDEAALCVLVAELAELAGDLERQLEVSRALAGLTEPPRQDDADAANLHAAIGELTAAAADLETRRSALGASAADLEAASRDLRRWADDHPLCPTCGAPVDACRLLAAGDRAHA